MCLPAFDRADDAFKNSSRRSEMHPGFWYIVLTALVAGGMFAALVLWRRSIVAAFAAHLALNLVEFVFVWLSVSKSV